MKKCRKFLAALLAVFMVFQASGLGTIHAKAAPTSDVVYVPVYAAANVGGRLNPDMQEILGVSYVDGNNYYPIGVITLPQSLFDGKRSPYIKTDADFNAVLAAIGEIDTTKLQNGAVVNVGNSVGSHLDCVQKDLNQGSGSQKTALFNWNSGESNNCIALINNTNYKYHLDLRFTTLNVNFVGKYYNSVDDSTPTHTSNGNLGTRVYLTNTTTKVPGTSSDWYLTNVQAGYEIAGYYTDEACTDAFVFGNPVTSETTIYVKLVKNEVTVTYDLNGGASTSFTGQTNSYGPYSLGQTTPTIETPTREHYDFVGWIDDQGNVYSGNNVAQQVSRKTTYTAQWQKTDYTIIYDLNGGTTTSEETSFVRNYGDTTPGIKDPTKTGDERHSYSFAGWAPTVAETVTGNATYTAQWNVTEYSPYTVEYYYQENGTYGQAASTDTRNAVTGSQVSVTDTDKTTTRNGYIFDDSTAVGNVLSGTNDSDGTLVLKVHFKQQFTVTYLPGDHGTLSGTTKTSGLDYGAATPAVPSYTADAGYAFNGWSPVRADNVTANAEYTAQWTANDDTKYTVEYYYQQNGQYSNTADSKDETRTGTTGATVSVTDADKNPVRNGYVYDSAANNVESGTIAGTGSLVLKVYFKQQFTVTYQPGNHGTFTQQSTTVDYNAAVPTAPQTTGDAGYSFAGWDKEIATPVTADAIYTAQWTANSNTKYTVEYYYQQNGQYNNTADSKDETRTGTTGATVSVTDADKNPVRNGYVYDSAANNVESGTIAGDGSLVLKVYFKQQFTVTYLPGDHGTFTQQSTTVDYNAIVPTAPQTTGDAGYSFAGWDKEIATPVTADATYTAQWTANSNTKYTVEYYYQQNGQYSNTADSKDETRTGTTGTTVNVTDADKTTTRTGYVYDLTSNNVESGTIAGDGSLVLKVYFKQQFTVTYQTGVHGTLTGTTETKGIDYGVATPGAPTVTAADGYTFTGWMPTVAATVTKDAVYTAQYSANANTAYTVEYYYQSEGEYADTTENRADRTGTTDTKASVTSEDKIAAEDGYVFDEDAANVLEGTIAGDGSLVLKVYFKEQFTVTYKPGTKGTFVEQKTENIDYGTETPAAPETTGTAGYTFDGWDVEVAETVTADATYTAQWVANEDTKYTVEHYLQNTDGESYPEEPTDVEELEGITDEMTEAEAKDYPGFTVVEPIEQLSIAGDGSTVVKIFYTRDGDTTYTVNHYLQDLDENYPEEPELTETLVGMTGTQTEAAAKEEEFPGFKAEEFEQAEIAGDGSTVIDIFYERQAYTVTYMVDGEKYGEVETYLVGETVEYRANPAKEGHTFSGWTKTRTNSFVMPAEDVVLEGTFTPNMHTITVIVDGAVIDVFEVPYGDETPVIETPAKEGFIFSGWDKELPDTMPDEDIVISGNLARVPQPQPQPQKPEQEVQGEHTDKPQEEPAPNPNRPDTGDHSQPMLWVMMMLMSMVGVVGSNLYGRKRKNQ